MQQLYYLETEVGTISIWFAGRHYLVEFEGDTYGSYKSIPKLLEDLAAGHTFPFPREIDTSQLNIPIELADWTPA